MFSAEMYIALLTGGTVLEQYATRRASAVLDALAKRMPRLAHRREDDAAIHDVDLADVTVGDTLVVFPHEICPVDSRYSKIMRVVQEAEQNRPRMRRLADRLGAWYTPVAVGVAVGGWLWSGDPGSFSRWS